MDPIRQDTFIKFIAMLEKKYCGLEWGDERLELANIVVHGQYHRRGVGKALMETGLKLARERNVAITLTAGPNGRSLYTSVGFKELGYDECSVPNEDEKIGVWTMIWTPEGWKKEGS